MLFLVTSYLKVVVVLLPLASVETIDIVLVPMFVGAPIVLFVLSNVSPDGNSVTELMQSAFPLLFCVAILIGILVNTLLMIDLLLVSLLVLSYPQHLL